MHRRLTDVFDKLNVEYEIIFVNDNSPDDSEEVIRAILRCATAMLIGIPPHSLVQFRFPVRTSAVGWRSPLAMLACYWTAICRIRPS